MTIHDAKYIRFFEHVGINDIGLVGGKNCSLGELTHALKGDGIRVPDGFATTADAYWNYLECNRLTGKIAGLLAQLNKKELSLDSAGRAIRRLILHAEFPEQSAVEIREAYRQLCKRAGVSELDVAVRSSATAEDLPDASFAGQQETFLNISGEKELLDACRHCYASLFTDRAISYRNEKHFDHMKVALSIGVQRMVRSDKGSAGVIFTLDTESGFPRAVIISAAYGLGENVVKGTITPDQYTVFKPLLEYNNFSPIIDKKIGDKTQTMVYASGGTKATKNISTPERQRRAFVLGDSDILQLARWACTIERHYGKPMDIEWAKDGVTQELFIVQARPETVKSRLGSVMKTYRLKQKGELLLSGISVGEAIAAGKVCRVLSVHDIAKVTPGSILVTEMTDPDWVPVMKKVAGIITDSAGARVTPPSSAANLESQRLSGPAMPRSCSLMARP